MRSTPAQLDAAEARLLKEWRDLVLAHRENRKWITHYRVIWRATRDVRATAIRAIRAQRKALDERESVIAYITHHASMTKRNALETAIHQSMLTLLAEHIRAGMHLGAP